MNRNTKQQFMMQSQKVTSDYAEYFSEDFQREEKFAPVIGGNLPRKEMSPSIHSFQRAMRGELKTFPNRKNAGEEFVFHAPKSLSVEFAGGNEKVFDAFQHAVELTTHEIERHIHTRIKAGDQDAERLTANGFFWTFYHTIKRDRTPSLHAHVLLINLTFDPIERQRKSIKFSSMKEHLESFQTFFSQALKASVEKAGFATRKTFTRNGTAWELESISDAMIDRFTTDEEPKRGRKRPKASLAEEAFVLMGLKREISDALSLNQKPSSTPKNVKKQPYNRERSKWAKVNQYIKSNGGSLSLSDAESDEEDARASALIDRECEELPIDFSKVFPDFPPSKKEDWEEGENRFEGKSVSRSTRNQR